VLRAGPRLCVEPGTGKDISFAVFPLVLPDIENESSGLDPIVKVFPFLRPFWMPLDLMGDSLYVFH
jgi:hypothetical protein